MEPEIVSIHFRCSDCQHEWKVKVSMGEHADYHCPECKSGKVTWTNSIVKIDRMGPKEVDLINHPPHYTSHPSGVECIEIVEHMNFNIGNAIKYLWRAGLKGDAIEDLEKARWYVEREIERTGKGADTSELDDARR